MSAIVVVQIVVVTGQMPFYFCIEVRVSYIATINHSINKTVSIELAKIHQTGAVFHSLCRILHSQRLQPKRSVFFDSSGRGLI